MTARDACGPSGASPATLPPMQDFSAPRTDSARHVDVDDEAPPRAGVLVILAVIAGVLAGMFGLADAIQLYLLVTFYTWWMGYLPFFFAALATGVLVTAGLSLRLKAWAALAFAGLAGLQVLVTIAWQIYAATQTLFDPMGIIWLVLALPAAALAPLTVPPALAATTYRKRLMEGL